MCLCNIEMLKNFILLMVFKIKIFSSMDCIGVMFVYFRFVIVKCFRFRLDDYLKRLFLFNICN